MKILIFAGFIMLYFVLGGIVSSIVMHYIGKSYEEDMSGAMIATVLWPAMVVILFSAIGIVIGDMLIDTILHSREKTSV